ncbi:DUF4255 domain-containing protein [Cellulomonas sp. HZM]|uniref:DUF4255 domain-containing protein n=1 Tax=Cellulomonas sp. HZM TaxID=1454010 RepID=UPI0004934A5D|nr:DUF4255 domain-containing protein [Cellulomonas sp. HZM]
MLIPTIDDGLERLLRASLPLAVDEGDVSFDAPSSTWSAQVNRLTVNLFLYRVSRSPQPPRPAQVRTAADGTTERRFPLPMVELSYLVSAWAGSPRDEHGLLGDVLTRLIAHQVLPAEHLARPPASPVQLALAADELNRPRELWSSLGGSLKASFTLTVTVAADAYDWQTAPPEVTGVEPVLGRLGRP